MITEGDGMQTIQGIFYLAVMAGIGYGIYRLMVATIGKYNTEVLLGILFLIFAIGGWFWFR